MILAKVNGANEQDGETCLKMFQENTFVGLSLIWADSAYRRAFLKEGLTADGIELSVVEGGIKEGYWVHDQNYL